MWSRVIKSRHGNVGCDQQGLHVEGRGTRGARASGWWRKLISKLGGSDSRWFWGKFNLELGDGRSSSFWKGPWAGEGSLSDRFPRLFYLSTKAEARVAEMGRWVNGRWIWELGWRRNLREREKPMVEELLSTLQQFELREGVTDRWRWGNTSNGQFTVKEAYGSIEREVFNLNSVGRAGGALDRIWKVSAPLKAQVSGWRAIRDRLPTRENLFKRLRLPMDQRNCCCCHHHAESGEHFFLRCSETERVWEDMVKWIGVSWAAPKGLTEHFLGFSGLIDGREMWKRMGGLWVCVVWVMWKWRNEVIFANGVWEFTRIVEEIKSRFWSWSVAKGILSRNTSFSEWSGRMFSET